MCLSLVSDYEPKMKAGLGWKVFSRDATGNLFPEIRVETRISPYPIGKWIKDTGRYTHLDAECTVFPSIFPKKYPAGFHIFKTREGARQWKKTTWRPCEIRKVEYNKALCEGTQEGQRVIVAHEILITETRE